MEIMCHGLNNKQLTPDVITTDWNRLKTGLTAIEASRQLKCKIGLEMVGVLSSNGSIINTKPANIEEYSAIPFFRNELWFKVNCVIKLNFINSVHTQKKKRELKDFSRTIPGLFHFSRIQFHGLFQGLIHLEYVEFLSHLILYIHFPF